MAFAFRRRKLFTALATAIVVIAATVPTNRSHAEGFRIETQIFVGDEEKPASTTTTLVREGVVYDFLEAPSQIAVFRRPTGGKPGRFILLSPAQRIQTEITTDQLAGTMDKLRSWASQQDDPFLKFAANPEFEESFDPGNGKLVLASHMESYTVDTVMSPHADALAAYREFLDWYTRLNTLISAGPPPEPRLKLNAALARYEVVPLKVELKRVGEKELLRAQHEFTWRLSRQDIERIDKVAASLTSYRTVSNSEFQKAIQAK